MSLAGESWANPARHEAVLRVLAGIGRQPTVRPIRRRHALSPTDLETILARLNPGKNLADARDAALLLIGWNAGLRTDDLARLDITDITVAPDQSCVCAAPKLIRPVPAPPWAHRRRGAR